jgi:hypothetical protein
VLAYKATLPAPVRPVKTQPTLGHRDRNPPYRDQLVTRAKNRWNVQEVSEVSYDDEINRVTTSPSVLKVMPAGAPRGQRRPLPPCMRRYLNSAPFRHPQK